MQTPLSDQKLPKYEPSHSIETRPGELELGEGVFSAHFTRASGNTMAVHIAGSLVNLDAAQMQELVVFVLTNLSTVYSGSLPETLRDRVLEAING